jgi:hypothetical protein
VSVALLVCVACEVLPAFVALRVRLAERVMLVHLVFAASVA